MLILCLFLWHTLLVSNSQAVYKTASIVEVILGDVRQKIYEATISVSFWVLFIHLLFGCSHHFIHGEAVHAGNRHSLLAVEDYPVNKTLVVAVAQHFEIISYLDVQRVRTLQRRRFPGICVPVDDLEALAALQEESE